MNRIYIPHSVGTVHLAQFHPTNNQARNDLASTLNDSVFSSVHVESSHAAKLLDLLHGNEPLDAESAEWSIVASGGDDEGSIDGVWVHAGLVIMVHGDKSPVGNNSCNAKRSIRGLTGDEIFDCRGVEKLDVGKGEHFREEGRSEESLIVGD